jgi:HEAT repeat protein
MTHLEDLASDSWRVRKNAILELLKDGDESLALALVELVRTNHRDLNSLNAALQVIEQIDAPVTSALIRLMDDPDPDIRTYTCLLLGNLRDESAIPALINALNDPEPNVCFNAIEGLENLPTRQAVRPLIDIFRRGDFFLSFAAIQALGEIGDPAPLPELLPMLEDSLLGPAAALAIGKVGDAQVISPILSWIESPKSDPAAGAMALAALAAREYPDHENQPDFAGHTGAANGPTIAEILADRITSDILEKILSGIPPQPLTRHNTASPESHTRSRWVDEQYLVGAASLLSRLIQTGLAGEDVQKLAVDRLQRLLHHPVSAEIAERGLSKAGHLAVNGLMARLSDSLSEVRYAAARILGEIGDSSASSALIRALEDEDPDLIALAACALGKIRSLGALDPLLKLIGHPNPRLGQTALDALCLMRHPDHALHMLSLIESEDPRRRASGVEGLACLIEEALSASGSLPENISQAIRKAARDPDARVRRVAIEPLAALAEAQDDLERAAKDGDPGVRQAVAYSLALKAPDIALPILHEFLHDSDPWVRRRACLSLGRQGRQASLEPLAELVHDPLPPVRIALSTALTAIGGKPARALLSALLEDPEPEVREAAQRAHERFSAFLNDNPEDMA